MKKVRLRNSVNSSCYVVLGDHVTNPGGYGIWGFEVLSEKIGFFFFLQGHRAAGQQGACINHQGLRKIRVPGQQERTIHILLSWSIFDP
jgi:hypothetical protein